MKKTAALKLQQQQKIREQIQQLRNIRKMMFDTFEIENQSSQVDQSTEEKTNIGNTKVQDENSKLKADGMQRSSSQSSMDHDSNNSTTQNYDHLYRKLKSTVQLLSESLEEQGNLKALLELTSNPSVYDQVFQSEIFHLSQVLNLNQPPNSKDEPLAISEDLLTNIKFRSLLLEREQLMSKIVDTRTNYEEEKTKRLQTENELKVLKEMLETAQQETEKYQKLYDELHQEYDQLYNHSLVNPLAFSQSQQRQQNRQLPPLTPPAGSSRSRFHFPPSHGHHPQYQPGIVPMEEEGEEEQAAEEDHDLLDMLDQEDQLEERLPVTSYPDQDHRPHQADRQQPTLFVHDEEVDDINTPVPNYHHPHHPEVQSTINPIRSRSPSPAPVSHSNTNNTAVRSRSTSPQPHQKSRSPSPSSSPVQQEVSPMTYIVLDIDLENNQKDQLIVTLDGDPLLLAYQFMERNNLADSYFLPLSEYIKDTQMQLLENYRRHLEETEEVISRSHSEEGEKISAGHVDDDKDPSLLQLDEIHDDEQQEEKEEEKVSYPDRSMRSNQSSSSPLQQQQHYSKEEDEELLLSLSLPISRDSRHSNGKQQQQREKIDIDLSDQKEGEGEESVDISHLLDDLFLVHPPSVSAEKDTKSKVQKKVATSPKNKKVEVEVEVDRDHDEFVLEEKPAENLPVAADGEEDEENFDLDDLDITLDRSDDLNHEESEDQHHEKKEEMKNVDNEEGYYSDSQDLNEIYNIIKQQQRQIQIQQAKLQDHFDQTDTNPINTKKNNRSQLHPVDRYIQEDLLAHSPSIHHPSTHSIQEMPHLAATGGTGTNQIKGKKISPTTYRSQYEISRNVRLPFSPHPNQLHSHKQLFPAEEEEDGGGDGKQQIDQEAEEEDQLSDYHSDNNDIGITDDHELDEDLLAEYENPEEEEVLDYHSDREVEEMKQHLYSPHRHDIVDLSDTGSNANNDQIQEEDQYPFPSEDEDEGERDEDDLLLDQFEEDYLEEDAEEEVVSPIQQEQQPVVEEKKPTPIRRSSQLLIQSVHPVVHSAAAPPPRSTSPKPSGNNNNNKVTTQSPPTGRQQVLPNKNPSTPSADDFRSLATQQQQQPGQLLGKNQEYNHLLSNLTENINNMEMFSPMSPMSPFPLDKSISNEEIEEIIEIALEIIQRANELRDAGQFQFAVPLYNNALKLLELSEYYELDHLKEEIMNSLL